MVCLYIIIHGAYEQWLLVIIYNFIFTVHHVVLPSSSSQATTITSTPTSKLIIQSSLATTITTTTPTLCVSSSPQYIIGISGLLVFIVLVITVTMVIFGLLCRKLRMRALKNKLSLYSENSVMLAVISAHEL